MCVVFSSPVKKARLLLSPALRPVDGFERDGRRDDEEVIAAGRRRGRARVAGERIGAPVPQHVPEIAGVEGRLEQPGRGRGCFARWSVGLILRTRRPGSDGQEHDHKT